MLGIFFAAVLSTPSQTPACAWRFDYVSSQKSVIVDAQKAAALDPRLSIAEVVREIGPAKRDTGSGIYALEWQLSDGRRLLVGAADACARPMVKAVIPRGEL